MEIALAIGFGFLLGFILAAFGCAAVSNGIDRKAAKAGVWVVDGIPYKLSKIDPPVA